MKATRQFKNTLPIQLPNPYHPGHTFRATADHLKPFFGIKEKAKWPAEGCKSILVFKAGTRIELYVRPLADPEPVETRYGTRQVRPGMHSRLMAVCPDCRKHFSYGRLHQHMAAHTTTTKGK